MVDAAGTTKYTYYAGGLLNTEDGPWVSDTVTYSYNNARLRSGLVLQQPTGTWTNSFAYDAAHRLSTVSSPAGTFTYTYKVGEASSLPIKLALPNSSYITNIYDNVARLTGTYHDNGNLSTRQYDCIDPRSYNYTYDAENQLTAMATDSYYTPTNSRWKTEFTYDGRGRLRKRIEYTWLDPYGWYGGVETRYVYDGMRVIQERDSGNTPTVSYTRGSDLSGSPEGAGGIGGLLARSDGYSSGNW